jgi:hypothetical protein
MVYVDSLNIEELCSWGHTIKPKHSSRELKRALERRLKKHVSWPSFLLTLLNA